MSNIKNFYLWFWTMVDVMAVVVFLISSAWVLEQKLPIRVNQTRFYIGNERFFLSGANTAWVHYAADFGNHQYEASRQEFRSLLSNVSQAGGNSMRTWVHVDGSTSPHFDVSGDVIGLDRDGTFLKDFLQYLDDARQRNILVFATLWNGAVVSPAAASLLHGLITNASKLQTYLDSALTPWVRAVKNHPAMGGWEVVNELEGVVRTGEVSADPCLDTTFLRFSTAGFAREMYHVADLLRFLNWQADAIRRVDPHALVTSGSWRQWSQSGAFGGRNLYSDKCLLKVGGRSQGTLTFYSTHVYAVLDLVFWPDAAFKHWMEEYELDKPLVVGEFSQLAGAGMAITDQFLWAYQRGYSGAWSWEANSVKPGSGSDSLQTQLKGIRALRNRNDQTQGGRINITISSLQHSHTVQRHRGTENIINGLQERKNVHVSASSEKLGGQGVNSDVQLMIPGRVDLPVVQDVRDVKVEAAGQKIMNVDNLGSVERGISWDKSFDKEGIENERGVSDPWYSVPVKLFQWVYCLVRVSLD